LGLLLTEFLSYEEMTKAVAKFTSRALGLLIAKCKAHGGFQYDVYTKLFDSIVWSVNPSMSTLKQYLLSFH
jgi:hypothetical protein